MSVLQLPDWIEAHADRIQSTCDQNPENLSKAADEVARLQSSLRGEDDVQSVLNGLWQLLLELPQTGELVIELAGGVRLNPNEHPSLKKVANALEIVKNIFVRKPQPETTDEAAYRQLKSTEAGKAAR